MAKLNTANIEHDIAYYTAVNAAHYPGVVALLNSLRYIGEEAPLFVVDCGLTSSQRDVLSRHSILVPPQAGLHPSLQKMTGPLAHPAETIVVLDADIIINRSLAPLFEDARLGRIVTFQERIPNRFFPEWSELGIGSPTQQDYVSGGHYVLSAATGSEFFPLFMELQERLDITETFFDAGAATDPTSNPYFYADQDILNAILCARYDGRVVRLGRSLWSYPPFSGLMLSGGEGLGCVYGNGIAPYLLHHFWKKPWLSPLEPSIYSELFTRLVTDKDAPIRLEKREIPLRLRDSRFAPIDRWRVSVQLAASRRFRGKLGIRPVLERKMKNVFRRVHSDVA
jgi:hypothetical protein